MAKINSDSEDNCECAGEMNDRGFDGTHLSSLLLKGREMKMDWDAVTMPPSCKSYHMRGPPNKMMLLRFQNNFQNKGLRELNREARQVDHYRHC